MAQGKNSTGLTDLLLKCMAEPDPMLSMPEWLCKQLMEAEVSGIVGAEKNAHNPSRNDYRCGYRPRRLDIPAWERCTLWCQSCAAVDTSRFL